MNGPEHYAEAVRLVSGAWEPNAMYREIKLQAAQVHATLALTAATISAAAHPGQSQVDYLGEWFRTPA